MNMIFSSRDTMTRQGAVELRARIINYWSLRGYWPNVEIEEHHLATAPTDGEHSFWVVRSNMIGGMPRPEDRRA